MTKLRTCKVEEERFLLGDRVACGPRAKNEECPAFGHILFGVGGGVIGYELILILGVESIQLFVIEIFIFYEVDLIPFFVNTCPELIVKSIDIGIGVGTAFAGEVFGAGG